MSDQRKYIVWVGGKEYWSRSYLAEIQTMELNVEQCELDDEELVEQLQDWDGLRQDMDECTVGYGAYSDQKIGVVPDDDDENPVMLEDVEDLMTDDRADYKHYLPYDAEGTHVICVQVEKGGYQGELYLPKDQTFDPEKIRVSTVCVADGWTVVNGVTYDGVDIDMEADTTNISCDYYKFEDDEATHIG